MSGKLTFVIVFSGIWGIVGVILFVVGIVTLNKRKKKEINCIEKTYGKVVDIVSHQSYDSDTKYTSISYYPVFEYSIGGNKFVKRHTFGTSQPKYSIGQAVEVYYNPKDYNEYYIAGDTSSKKIPVILTLVGIAAIIIAIVSAIIISNVDFVVY